MDYWGGGGKGYVGSHSQIIGGGPGPPGPPLPTPMNIKPEIDFVFVDFIDVL